MDFSRLKTKQRLQFVIFNVDFTLSIRWITNAIFIENSIALSQTTVCNHLNNIKGTLKVVKSVRTKKRCRINFTKERLCKKIPDFERNNALSELIMLLRAIFRVYENKISAGACENTCTLNFSLLEFNNISFACFNRNGIIYKNNNFAITNRVLINILGILYDLKILFLIIFFKDSLAGYRAFSTSNIVNSMVINFFQ